MRIVSFTLLATGLLAVCFGISLEILLNEPIYFVVITAGSCLFAGGSLGLWFKGIRDD